MGRIGRGHELNPKRLKWLAILVVLVVVCLFLILVTPWLLLRVPGFYFFWSIGLSAVASYMLTDFAERRVFGWLQTKLGMQYQNMQVVTFVEVIFSMAVLTSLLDYAFDRLLANHIDLLLILVYPPIIGLGTIYYLKVYRLNPRKMSMLTP